MTSTIYEFRVDGRLPENSWEPGLTPPCLSTELGALMYLIARGCSMNERTNGRASSGAE